VRCAIRWSNSVGHAAVSRAADGSRERMRPQSSAKPRWPYVAHALSAAQVSVWISISIIERSAERSDIAALFAISIWNCLRERPQDRQVFFGAARESCSALDFSRCSANGAADRPSLRSR